MRCIGAAHRDLAVLVEHSLPLGRNVRPNCRTEKEGMHTPVIVIAVLLICIGVFAFFAVLLRLV
jgi:hypothetical protein